MEGCSNRRGFGKYGGTSLGGGNRLERVQSQLISEAANKQRTKRNIPKGSLDENRKLNK